jgi:hypothetical protein
MHGVMSASTMRRAIAIAALAVLAAGRAGAQEQQGSDAPCKLPPYIARALAGAHDGQMVSLGETSDRNDDPLAADRDRFVGFRALQSAPLADATIARLRAALSAKRLVCSGAKPGSAAFGIGFDLSGGGGELRLVVLPGSGEVDFELPNGLRMARWLTPAGAAAWNRCFGELAAQLRRTPEQLRRELTPGGAAAADSSRASAERGPGTH